jgi:hypothetical protein
MPDPCPYYLNVERFLNLPSVQASLGVPVNFTWDSAVITAVFGFPSGIPNTGPYSGSGDLARQAGLANIEYLLSTGVKVAIINGDRDYRVPWMGVETVAKSANWTHQSDFLRATYKKIQGVGTGDQGVVKQAGQLSMSRVFDSGHAVNAYAPEIVYRIFNRVMFDKDIETAGKTVTVGGGYMTKGGPTSAWDWRNTLPKNLPGTCRVDGHWTKITPWAGFIPTAQNQ